MSLIALGVIAAAGLAKTIAGGVKAKKNREAMDDLLQNRPDYEIPEGYFDNVELAQAQASRTRLPGQSQYEQQIGARTAAGIRQSREAATSSGDLLAATSNLYGQEADALTNLQIQAAQQQVRGEANLMSARNTLSSQQEKKFNWETAVPYQTRINQYAKSAQAGNQMMSQGFNTMTSAAMAYGSGQYGANATQSPTGSMGSNWTPEQSNAYSNLSSWQAGQNGGKFDSLGQWNKSKWNTEYKNPYLNNGGSNF